MKILAVAKILNVKKLDAVQVAVRISRDFQESVWNPLVEKLGVDVPTTQILKEGICLRYAIECDDCEVIIRTKDGLEHELKKFISIE